MEKSGINIAVLGKTGVGKSSFCNYMFGNSVFRTGEGRPVTGWEDHFKSHSVDHQEFTLKVYDSVGIEPDNYERWKSELDGFLKAKSSAEPVDWVHGALYVINAASARVEKLELELISSLMVSKVPTHVVLTNCDNATQEQLWGVRKSILTKWSSASITEVCSVSIRKRSGSTEQVGKEETINAFIGKLDSGLRSRLVNYVCDTQIAALTTAKNFMVKKIRESELGLYNIIKGFVQEGESFDLDGLFNFDDLGAELDAAADTYQQMLTNLDSFLMDLGCRSSDGSTMEVLDAIREQISDDIDNMGDVMSQRLDSLTNTFENGSLWEKAKAMGSIAGIVIDLKGFLSGAVNEMINGAIASLETHKVTHG